MTTRPFEFLAIGEVAIRVSDMDAMVEFYQNVLQMRLRRRFANKVAALEIATGVAGQVQTLTLFSSELPSNFTQQAWKNFDTQGTTLHHFAITISAASYESAIDFFNNSGVTFTTADHRWCGWRGIYVQDPEGNVIEFVSYHENLDEGKSGDYDFNKLHGSSAGKAFV